MGKLDGKVAVITGAAAGIGRATSKLFTQEGGSVFLVDVNEESLKGLQKELGSDKASYVVADVSQPDQAQRYTQAAVDRWGGIDVYIANAGILGPVLPVTDYPVESFDEVIAVNLRGVWLGLKYVVPVMQQRGGGSIVIMSSIAGVKGFPGLWAYCAVKHGLVGIMRAGAIEFAPLGIRVNTVHPGPIETAMIRELESGFAPGDPELGKQALEGGSLLGRYGSPEEVAKMLLFLSCDESQYCTGGMYSVDGGMAIK